MLKNDIIYTIIMLLGEFMNEFEIINETEEEIEELSKLKDVVDFALKHENIENSIFNIIIVDEETIRELNKNYRGKDSVTDVISFALEDDDTFVKTDFRVLGDMFRIEQVITNYLNNAIKNIAGERKIKIFEEEKENNIIFSRCIW